MQSAHARNTVFHTGTLVSRLLRVFLVNVINFNRFILFNHLFSQRWLVLWNQGILMLQGGTTKVKIQVKFMRCRRWFCYLRFPLCITYKFTLPTTVIFFISQTLSKNRYDNYRTLELVTCAICTIVAYCSISIPSIYYPKYKQIKTAETRKILEFICSFRVQISFSK